ncbi:hypothetical protein [Actinoplanes sp. NPDC051494]|uniref:hypothetical protein n=1 Tax=Actinoplanes sp. NPDC051494 TaxID=3363907 RepID=UPI0037B5BF69
MPVLRWVGLIAGAVVAVITVQWGGLGEGLMLAAPLFGLCVCLGVLAAELTVRAPKGPTRSATLQVRRIRDYLPGRLGWAVAGTGGLLLVVATATTSAGSADDMGRPGRSLTRQCTADLSQSHGPWPGWYYTGRLAVVVLVGLLLAYLALRTIVQRPRTGDATADNALRGHAARAVTGAAGILVAIPLGGVSLVASGALRGIDCAPAWWTVASWGLNVVVLGSLAIVTWCVAAILPQPR